MLNDHFPYGSCCRRRPVACADHSDRDARPAPPALDKRPEDALMLAREPGPMRLEKPIAESAHDVGHLIGWPRHRGCNLRERVTVSGLDTRRVSKGLGTAAKWRRDRCR
jgi:hypothetical protein